MDATIAEKRPPKGAARWFLRAPLVLYRARLGWLLGERFLMLTHTGRTSGAKRRTVVEVVDHDRTSDTYFVASGWGDKSDWLRNVTKTPRVEVDVGRRHFETDATRLSTDDAARRLLAYAERHPRAFAYLGTFMLGERLDASEAACRKLAERIPLVSLRPSPRARPGAHVSAPPPAPPPRDADADADALASTPARA